MKAIIVLAVMIVALLLQTTVFPELTLLGVKPELLYLVTVVAMIVARADDQRAAHREAIRSQGRHRVSCSKAFPP